MKVKVFKKQLITRNLPKNLLEDDSKLFLKELEIELNSSYVYISKNCKITYEGVVFQNGIPILKSFYHLTPKPNLRNLLAFIIRQNKLKNKNLKHDIMWISDSWSKNYFHWFLDALPRLLILSEYSNVVLLPTSFKKFDFITSSLELLNITIVYIDKEEIIQCKSVLFAPKLNSSGNYRPEQIKTLRSTLVGNWMKLIPKSNIIPPKRIYIHRKSPLCRSLKNENAVYDILENYNVEVVNFENFSWFEQIEYLSKCEMLIGAHGAGLTNMLFIPETAKLLELRQVGNTKDNCYFSLASALCLDYYYFNCDYQLFEGSDRFGIFEIEDLGEFENLLNSITEELN